MEPGHESKIRVGVFFGGKSAEHEISVQSAKNIVEALDGSKFIPTLIVIDRGSNWHELSEKQLANVTAVEIAPETINKLDLLAKIDVAMPILHGPLGEDGTIQGLFEIIDLPYVGPGVLGSAVSMDKDVAKRLLIDAGIPTAPYQTLYAHEQALIDYAAIQKRLGGELFVKPANMGSSVGVSRVNTLPELQKAVATAFEFDTKILVETAIHGTEIECSVLGNLEPKASAIGQIRTKEGDFYSYEAKYIDEKGAVLEIPAQVSEDVATADKELAIKTYKALNCEGMSRVDMFLTPDGELVVGELNTIPGFTKISMFPKLWEASGLSYTDLITELIQLALERHERRSSLRTTH